MQIEEIWQQVLVALKSKMPLPAYETWIKPLEPLVLDNKHAIFQVDSTFNRDWILKNYRTLITTALESVLNHTVKLDITVSGSSYKNYNLNKSKHNDYQDRSSSKFEKNYKFYKGLYQKIHSDPLFKEAQSWGVNGRMLYACVRDYGEYRVKDVIHRISPKILADSYFRQGQPIPQQRGRLFTAEMKKLREQKAS